MSPPGRRFFDRQRGKAIASTLAKASRGLQEGLGTPRPSIGLGIAFSSTGRGKRCLGSLGKRACQGERPSQARLPGVVFTMAFSSTGRVKTLEGTPRENPPLCVRVLSILKPREAPFPRQGEGKGHRQRGSAGEGPVGEQSSPNIEGQNTPNLKVGGFSTLLKSTLFKRRK